MAVIGNVIVGVAPPLVVTSWQGGGGESTVLTSSGLCDVIGQGCDIIGCSGGGGGAGRR